MRNLLGLALLLCFLPGRGIAELPDVSRPLRTGEAAPKDAAVVISVENYPFLKLNVPFAGRDGDAFENYLLYTRGVPKARIQRLTDPTRETMVKAFKEAADEAQGGTLWLYFAGHSAVEGRERVLVGADVPSDETLMSGRLLKLSELQDVGGHSKATAVVMVLDACNVALGKRPLVPAALASASPKVVVWSATSENEQSGPLPGASQGAFTYAVVGALRGWADGEKSGRRDGQVELEEAELFVERFLKEQGVRTQRPQAVGPKGRGAWVLSKAGEIPPTGEGAPAVTATPATPAVGAAQVTLGGNADFAGLAANAKAGEEAAAQAERRRRLDAAAESVRQAAARDYAAIRALVERPTAEGKPVLERYLGRYGAAQVSVDGVTEPVSIAEVALVQSALKEEPARAESCQSEPSGGQLTPALTLDSAARYVQAAGFTVVKAQPESLLIEMEGIKIKLFTRGTNAQLYTTFNAPRASLALMNEWNKTKRFSRAYLDTTGSPVLESDLDLEGGVAGGAIVEWLRTFRISAVTFAALMGGGTAPSLSALPVICSPSAEVEAEVTLDELAELVTRVGLEVLERRPEFILININGVKARLFTRGTNAQLYAVFQAPKAGLRTVNEWNKTKRFSRAYLDQDNDPVLESDIDLDGGVTERALMEWMLTYRISVTAFAKVLFEQH